MTLSKHFFLTALAGSLVWLGQASTFAAEDDAPKPEGDKGAKVEKGDKGDKGEKKIERREMRDRGPERGGPGGEARGRGEGGAPWAGGLNIPNLGGMGGRGAGGNNVINMASRMLGIEIEDPKAQTKLEELPLGAEKRQVVNVPVGGVDNPGGTGAGWKMESVFKLTEEQTKALETVRSEYEAEQKKMDAEIKEQMKQVAEKVKQLRQKYELRANDVLAGEDKASKEKMDAIAIELQNKNTAIVKEVQPLFDMNDMQQGFAMIRMIREKTSTNLKDYETKLMELIPPANRETIAEVIKRQTEMREQMNRWMGGGGFQRGGNNGGGDRPERPERAARRDGEAVKPPHPPEADKKGDF